MFWDCIEPRGHVLATTVGYIYTDIIMMDKTHKLDFHTCCLEQHLDGVLTLLLHTEC